MKKITSCSPRAAQADQRVTGGSVTFFEKVHMIYGPAYVLYIASVATS